MEDSGGRATSCSERTQPRIEQNKIVGAGESEAISNEDTVHDHPDDPSQLHKIGKKHTDNFKAHEAKSFRVKFTTRLAEIKRVIATGNRRRYRTARSPGIWPTCLFGRNGPAFLTLHALC